MLCFVQQFTGLSTQITFGSQDWPVKGNYKFQDWVGPEVGIHFSIPSGAGPDTPILFVIPGAKRNADAYRDQWHHLSNVHHFIVLSLEGRRDCFPSEYEYNAGGVLTKEGVVEPKERWLYSVIELVFDDFCHRFGSNRKTYSIYGHSAGGEFVHRFVLFQPKARCDVAVAANPVIFTMPTRRTAYPFGLQGASLSDGAAAQWFGKKLVILLASRDTGRRVKPLNKGLRSNAQGLSACVRGRRFFHAAILESKKLKVPLRWKLDVIPNAGHSNLDMASHAIPHLFP